MTIEYKRLICAVLIQALKDWQRGRDQSEIREFLLSDRFAGWAEAIGLNPSRVWHTVESGNCDLSGYRATYR